MQFSLFYAAKSYCSWCRVGTISRKYSALHWPFGCKSITGAKRLQRLNLYSCTVGSKGMLYYHWHTPILFNSPNLAPCEGSSDEIVKQLNWFHNLKDVKCSANSPRSVKLIRAPGSRWMCHKYYSSYFVQSKSILNGDSATYISLEKRNGSWCLTWCVGSLGTNPPNCHCTAFLTI